MVSLVAISNPEIVLVAIGGVMIGLIFGILPGLGGLTTLALLLPFVYSMEPLIGLTFLLSAHAAVNTGGSVSAIILGIPGSPPNAATVADGFSLQQQGKGFYAVGAGLMASALGGILGALILILLLPVLQSVVLAFGAPEIFLLVLLGLAYATLLGQNHPVKGLLSASLGIFIATIGYQRATGIPRFWFGSEYMLDGIRLIPLILGLFAVPEIVSLILQKPNKKHTPSLLVNLKDIFSGAKEVIKHPWLFLRSSLIGVIVGIVPGVGGETAPYIAYAVAKSSSKTSDSFGQGNIEGVIAPESSNNAKEGGSLVPTMALGIPGSASMSILLGGFLILGIEPGPDFLNNHMDLAKSLAFLLAATNILSALAMVPLSFGVARSAAIKGDILAPILLILVVAGTYISNSNILDVWAVFLFGAMGVLMKAFNFNRPALILGFILGDILETYLYITVQAYGLSFIARPISLCILLLLLAGPIIFFRRNRNRRNPSSGNRGN